jgi:hypothetical protein
METKSLSRAERSMFASEASNPRSGRDIDAEHGLGSADVADLKIECFHAGVARDEKGRRRLL